MSFSFQLNHNLQEPLMQIPFLICPSQHLKSQLYMVCIAPCCPSNRLVCLQCHPTLHKDHKLVSLSDFLSLVKSSQTPLSMSDPSLLCPFKEKIAGCVKTLNDSMAQFNSKVNQLNSDLNRLSQYITPNNSILYFVQNINHCYSKIIFQCMQPTPNRTEIERYIDYIVHTIKQDDSKIRIQLPYDEITKSIDRLSQKLRAQYEAIDGILASCIEEVAKKSLRIFKTFQNQECWTQASERNTNQFSFSGGSFSFSHVGVPPGLSGIFSLGPCIPQSIFPSRLCQTGRLFGYDTTLNMKYSPTLYNQTQQALQRLKQAEVKLDPVCCFMKWNLPEGITNWGFTWTGNDVLLGVGIPQTILLHIVETSYFGDGCVMLDVMEQINKLGNEFNSSMVQYTSWFEFNSHKATLSVMTIVGQEKVIEVLELERDKLHLYKIGMIAYKPGSNIQLINEGKPIYK